MIALLIASALSLSSPDDYVFSTPHPSMSSNIVGIGVGEKFKIVRFEDAAFSLEAARERICTARANISDDGTFYFNESQRTSCTSIVTFDSFLKPVDLVFMTQEYTNSAFRTYSDEAMRHLRSGIFAMNIFQSLTADILFERDVRFVGFNCLEDYATNTVANSSWRILSISNMVDIVRRNIEAETHIGFKHVGKILAKSYASEFTDVGTSASYDEHESAWKVEPFNRSFNTEKMLKEISLRDYSYESWMKCTKSAASHWTPEFDEHGKLTYRFDGSANGYNKSANHDVVPSGFTARFKMNITNGQEIASVKSAYLAVNMDHRMTIAEYGKPDLTTDEGSGTYFVPIETYVDGEYISFALDYTKIARDIVSFTGSGTVPEDAYARLAFSIENPEAPSDPKSLWIRSSSAYDELYLKALYIVGVAEIKWRSFWSD